MLPKIQDVQPSEIRPGDEVTVVASGGYFQDDCGGFNESARVYKLYLDDEPVADLVCYVNHCEGKFVMPLNAALGAHCRGVEKGTCQLEVQVAGR